MKKMWSFKSWGTLATASHHHKISERKDSLKPQNPRGNGSVPPSPLSGPGWLEREHIVLFLRLGQLWSTVTEFLWATIHVYPAENKTASSNNFTLSSGKRTSSVKWRFALPRRLGGSHPTLTPIPLIKSRRNTPPAPTTSYNPVSSFPPQHQATLYSSSLDAKSSALPRETSWSPKA